MAGRLFAAMAANAEKPGEITEPALSEHRAYVTGAVIFAAAFLESSINELYLEAQDPGQTHNSLAGLDTSAIRTLAMLWPKKVSDYSALRKFQKALVSADRIPFDEEAEPFQGIDALIRIRNALIHYKPEWDDDLDVHATLRKRLEGRFDENALVPVGVLWFPHRCLSAGCASWAVDQAATFMTEFCVAMGIPNRVPLPVVAPTPTQGA